MESMIDILFDQLVDSDAAWDTQHDKATQDKLGELISTEAVAQARAGFRAGFVAAMKLCEEVKNKAE